MYNECRRQFSHRKLIRGCRGTERDRLRPDLFREMLSGDHGKTVSGTVFAQKDWRRVWDLRF